MSGGFSLAVAASMNDSFLVKLEKVKVRDGSRSREGLEFREV